jgi:hypothetical protein
MSITITKINENYHFVDGENAEVVLTPESVVFEKKTGKYWLKLPVNSLNRKLVCLSKFDDCNVVTIDNVKQPVTITHSTTSSKLEDYMTEEEKKIIADIHAKAEARRDEAKKKAAEAKKDPVQKAKAKVASAIEALKALGMSDEAIAKLIGGQA